MLGSADELELGTDHDGLLTLTGELVPGTPLPDAIPVEGVVLVIAGNPPADEVVEALTTGKRRESEPASGSPEA
jgi:hypothetical protein